LREHTETLSRRTAVCYPPGARPPDVPADLIPPMTGGAGGVDAVLTSADGTAFRTYLARAAEGDAGVVIAPDVRGLHPFYEELAERFASAGVHAIAFDYFGRTARTDRRADDFDYTPHVRQTTPKGVFADIATSRAYLEKETKARRTFVLGFCFGGRIAFLSSAEVPNLAGVVGFYGRLNRRENETWPVPMVEAKRMRAPVLGLFGGADPGITYVDIGGFGAGLQAANVKYKVHTYPDAPHSFFDRTFNEHKGACDDAWRRVLGFMRTGDPATTA
jgi:carboxymethylenebutenolidase